MSIIKTGSIYFRSLLLLGAMALVLTTIDAVSEQTQDKKPNKNNVEAQEMKKEWSEAIKTLKQYSADQRDEALSQAQQTLATMDRRIEQLQTRADDQWRSMSKTMREQREEALRYLRLERNDLAEWYGGMKYSSDNAWEEVKQGFISAYDSLSNSLNRAYSEFSDPETKDRSTKSDEDKGNKRQ